MKGQSGFERFLAVVRKIEAAGHLQAFEIEECNDDMRQEIELNRQETEKTCREIEECNDDMRQKAKHLVGLELWEAFSNRFLFLSPADRTAHECLLDKLQVKVDPLTLQDAVCRRLLWKRLNGVKVRLCSDDGVLIQKGVTETQFTQQQWGTLRVGYWGDHRIWIGKPDVVKIPNRRGRRIADKKAYAWLEDRLQNYGWTFDDGAVHTESGVRLGPAELHRTIREALSDSNGELKRGITLPKDHKTPVGWAKKISGLDQE